ncbi:MAG: carboxypeptidase-like regulatory domain-containing protein [Ginsengibacter sp.]
MKKYLLLLTFLFLAEHGISQTETKGSVRVDILNSGKNPLDNTTVLLLREKDSQVVKIQLSDSTGMAVFTKIFPGKYLLKASHVGYRDFFQHSLSL